MKTGDELNKGVKDTTVTSGMIAKIGIKFLGLPAFAILLVLFITIVLIVGSANVSFNQITHTNEKVSDMKAEDVEVEEVKKEDTKYSKIITQYMIDEHSQLEEVIQKHCKQNGVTFTPESIVDNSCIPYITSDESLDSTDAINKMIQWAEKIAADDTYKYYSYAKNQTCPICNPGQKYKGWQCIGFVTAALKHGAGINVKCRCDGIGNNQLFNKSNNEILSEWKKNTRTDKWIMIASPSRKTKLKESQLQKGDILIGYRNGRYQHVSIYKGDGEVVHAANEKSGIVVGKFKHVSTPAIAMRYTGASSTTRDSQMAEKIASMAEKTSWAARTLSFKYKRTTGGKPYKENDFESAYKKYSTNTNADTKNGSCSCHYANYIITEASGKKMKTPLAYRKTHDTMKCKKYYSKYSFDFFDWDGQYDSLKRGDILVAKGKNDSGHVMIYIGNKKIVHADEKKHLYAHQSKLSSTNYASTNNKSFYCVMRASDIDSFNYKGKKNTTSVVESFKSVKILSTIKPSQGTKYKLSNPEGEYNVTQSFARTSNGDYIVAACNKATPKYGYLRAYTSKGKLITSKKAPIYHANGMTYDDEGVKIAGRLTGSLDNKALKYRYDPGEKPNLRLIPNGEMSLRGTASGLGYDRDTGNYILSKGGSLEVYDKTLSTRISRITKKHNRYAQDVCAAGGMIFSCHSVSKGNAASGSGVNYVDIYRENDGAYCGSYKLNYGEIESAEIVDGELVILNHMKGTRDNYIHYTGIKPPLETVTDAAVGDGAGTRDVTTIIAAFSVYEAQFIPIQMKASEMLEEGESYNPLWNLGKVKLYTWFHRDVAPKKTLDAILKTSRTRMRDTGRPSFFEITYSDPITKDGKKIYPLIEINPADGEYICELFSMSPNERYTTEFRNSKRNHKKLKAEDIGETTIASAIETSTDDHLELLYGSLNGKDVGRGILGLPIKSLFTSLKLSKTFAKDKKGIECKPKEGTLVYSSERGMVDKIVQDDPKLGNYIVIKGDYTIVYAHLKKITVKEGEMLSRNRVIGESTNLFRMEVYLAGSPVDPEPLMQRKDFSSGGGNDSIADAAVAIAYRTRNEGLGNNGTPTYRKAHDKVIPGDHIYMSCDRCVCTAVRWSGADDSYPPGACGAQLSYLRRSSKWKKVNINSESDLKPGDVFINLGHTYVYVGNKAVQKKYKGSNANTVSASYQQRSPGCDKYAFRCNGSTVYQIGDSTYEVFRNVKKEVHSKYK